jgi:endonuclease YncB( thermonuclease family)
MYQYQLMAVSQVVAGDEMIVTLDLGFRLTAQVELNLANVKTERYGSVGQQARIFSENFLKEEHGPFVVQVSKDRKDNYEAQIFNSSGEDLGDALIEAKLGRSYGS